MLSTLFWALVIMLVLFLVASFVKTTSKVLFHVLAVGMAIYIIVGFLR